MAKEKIVLIKVFESTRKALKVIAAKDGITQPEALKPIVDARLLKIESKK